MRNKTIIKILIAILTIANLTLTSQKNDKSEADQAIKAKDEAINFFEAVIPPRELRDIISKYGQWELYKFLAICDQKKGEQLFSFQFSPKDNKYLALLNENKMEILDISSNQPIATFPGWSSVGSILKYSPNGKYLAFGGDSNFKILDLSDMTQIKKSKIDFDGAANSMVFSSDNKLLAFAIYGIINIVDINSGKEIKKIDASAESISSLTFSPNALGSSSQFLASSGSYDGVVKIWGVDSGNLIKEFECHKNSVISIAYSPDGKNFGHIFS